ncbi:uncharacterized protein LOC135467584 [Liolophura sinensis]|uniref:uncharacterized protein LOC135467584 n=1 Tax=Liolophura sinensis TaxID=3198878 RepID=UPI0031585445
MPDFTGLSVTMNTIRGENTLTNPVICKHVTGAWTQGQDRTCPGKLSSKTAWFKLYEDFEAEDSQYHRNLSASSIADQHTDQLSTISRLRSVHESRSNITTRSQSDSDLPRRLFGEPDLVDLQPSWSSDLQSRNSSASVSWVTSRSSSVHDSRLRSTPTSPSSSQLSNASRSSCGLHTQKKVWFVLSEDCESDSEVSQRVSSSSSDLTQHSASFLQTPELTQHVTDSRLQDSRTPPTGCVHTALATGERDLTQYQAHSTTEHREFSVRSSPVGELTQPPVIPLPSDSLKGSRSDSRDLTQYPWRLTQSTDITQHSNYSGRASQDSELSLVYADPTQYTTQQSLSLSTLGAHTNPGERLSDSNLTQYSSGHHSVPGSSQCSQSPEASAGKSCGVPSFYRHDAPVSSLSSAVGEQSEIFHQLESQGQNSTPVSQSASCRTSGVGSTFSSSTGELGLKQSTRTTANDVVVGRSPSSAFYTPSSRLTSCQQTGQQTSSLPLHESNTFVSQLKSLHATCTSSCVTPKAPCVTPTSPCTSRTSPLESQRCKSDIPSHSQSQRLVLNSHFFRRSDSSDGASETSEATCTYKSSEGSTKEPGFRDSGLVLQHTCSGEASRQTVSICALYEKSSEPNITQQSDQGSLSKITFNESEWMPVPEDKGNGGSASSVSLPAEVPDVELGVEPATHQCDKSGQEGRDPKSSGESGLGVSTETEQVSVNVSHLSGSSFCPLTEDTCSSQNSSSSWKMSSPERAVDQGDQEPADLSQSQVPNLSFNDSSKDSTSLPMFSPQASHRYTSSDEDWRSETDGVVSEADGIDAVESPSQQAFSDVLMGISEQAVHEALSGILQEQAVQTVVSEISSDFVSGNLSMDGRRSSDSSQLSSDKDEAGIEREFRGSISGLYPESYGGLSDVDWNIYTSNESDNNITPRSAASSGQRELPVGGDLSISHDTRRPYEVTDDQDIQDGVGSLAPRDITTIERGQSTLEDESATTSQHSENETRTCAPYTTLGDVLDLKAQNQSVTPNAEESIPIAVTGPSEFNTAAEGNSEMKDPKIVILEARADANDSTSSESGRGSGSKSASLSEDYNLTKHDETSFTYSEYSRENSNVSDVLSTDGKPYTETDTKDDEKEPVSTSVSESTDLTVMSPETLAGVSSNSTEDHVRLIVGQDDSKTEGRNSLVSNMSTEAFAPMNETRNSEYHGDDSCGQYEQSFQSHPRKSGSVVPDDRPLSNREESSTMDMSGITDVSRPSYLVPADDSEFMITSEKSYQALLPSFSHDVVRLSVSSNGESLKEQPVSNESLLRDRTQSSLDSGMDVGIDNRQRPNHMAVASDSQHALSDVCDSRGTLRDFDPHADTLASRFRDISDRASTPTGEASQLPDFQSLTPPSLLSAKSSSSFPLLSGERRELSERMGESSHSELYKRDHTTATLSQESEVYKRDDTWAAGMPQHSAPARLDQRIGISYPDKQQTIPKRVDEESYPESHIMTRDSRLMSDNGSDEEYKSSDDLSRKVEYLLSNTAHLAEHSETSPPTSNLGRHIGEHRDSPQDLDYDSLHQDLDIIQDSLKTSSTVPGLLGLDRADLANSTVNTTPPKLSFRSNGGTGSPSSDLDTSRRKFLWDYGADIGYDDGQGRFIGHIKDITGTENNVSGPHSRERLSNYSSRSATPMQNLDSANQTLTDQEDVFGEMSLCSQSVLNVDETISEKEGEVDFSPQSQYLPEVQKPLICATRSKSLTEIRERRSLTPSGGMAIRVSQLLEREDPNKQAVSILRDVSAEEKDFLRQISAERRGAAGSEPDISSIHSPKISSRKGIEVSPRMSRSFSSERYSPSPILQRILEKHAGSDQELPRNLSSSYEYISSLRGHGSSSSAFSNAKTFLSDQLNKMSSRQFDQSIELRSPVRRVIDCYPLYRTESDRTETSQERAEEGTQLKQAGQEGDTPEEAQSKADNDRQQLRWEEERDLSDSRPVPQQPSEVTHAPASSSSLGVITDTRSLREETKSLQEYHTPQQALRRFHPADLKASPATSSTASSLSEVSSTSPSNTDYNAACRHPVTTRYRPYKPAGSHEVYYTESETDDKMSGTDSVTTVESTHPGSDDARGPEFPAHVLGSRPDGVNSQGVYGNRKTGPMKDVERATSLSTIEEKSQADDKEHPPYRKPLECESEKVRRCANSRGAEPQAGPSPRTRELLDHMDHTLQQNAQTEDKTQEIRQLRVKGDNPEFDNGDDDNDRRNSRKGGRDPLGQAGANPRLPIGDKLPTTNSRVPPDDRLPTINSREDKSLKGRDSQTDLRNGEIRRGLTTNSVSDVHVSSSVSTTRMVGQETYGSDLGKAKSSSSSHLPGRRPLPEDRLGQGPRGAHTHNCPLGENASSTCRTRCWEDEVRVTGPGSPLSEYRSSSEQLYHKPRYPADRVISRSLEDLSFTSQDRGRGSSSLASHAISPPSPHHSPILPQSSDYHSPSRTDARSLGRQEHLLPTSGHALPEYVSVAERNKLTGLSPLPVDIDRFLREPILKEPRRSCSASPPQHTYMGNLPKQCSQRDRQRDESGMDVSSELVDCDKAPISRVARLLQDSLHQNESLASGLSQDVNTYWERFQELHTDSDSSMSSERLGALADLIRNPSRHVVKQYLQDRESERKHREAWVEKERGERRREESERKHREAWVEKERGERRREENERKRHANAIKRQKIVDGSYSETLEESNGYSSERSRDERGVRKLDDSSLKPYQRELSYDSSVIDTLYSIPEDPSMDMGHSPSTSSDTFQSVHRPTRRQRNVIDPHMQKLKSKISKQRLKYEKQKRKEVQRLAKIQRLEELLRAKKSGKISNKAFEKEVANLSSSTVQASSSEMSSEASPRSTDFTAVSSQMSSDQSSATLTPRSTSEDSTMEHLAWISSYRKGSERTEDKQGRQPRHDKTQAVEQVKTRKDKYKSPVRNGRVEGKSPSRKKKAVMDEPPFVTQKVQYERVASPSPSRGGKSPSKDRHGRKAERSHREVEKDMSWRSTRDVSVMIPSPRKSRRPEMVSSSVQTTPHLNQRQRSRSGSPSPSRYPVRSERMPSKERRREKPRHRSSSPKPHRSNSRENKPPRKTRRSLPAGSPGVAWFVPMDDPRPWRKPLRERQALALSQYPDLPRPLPENDCSEVESFMEMYLTKSRKSSSDQEPSEDHEEEKPLSKMTLQEAFLKFKADVVSRSKARQRRIALASKERQLEEMLGAERAQLFMDQRYQDVIMQYHPLSENLFKPRKRSMSKSEMKELTARLYNRLPEVVQKRLEEKRLAEYKVNRIRAKMFNKKIQRSVLGKPTPWYA